MLIVFVRLFISTMGVTLERVQNKFACIIGELTNEPLVLSQFAIWVDLRISEYKSKGTISLDCSGESPDPSWLKGHINPPLHSLPSSLTGHGGVHNSFTQKARLPSRDSSRLYQNNRSVETVEGVEYVSDRLSPEVQAIKEEMSEGIYPVSVHKHDGAGTRKRTAESFQSSDQSLYSQSEGSFFPGQNSSNTFTGGTPKARRVEAAGDDSSAVESPSNQSFMSVIGDSFQETDDPSQSDTSLLEEQSRGGNLASRFSAANAPASMSSPSTSDGARPGTSGSAAPDGQRNFAAFGGNVPDMSMASAGGIPLPNWPTTAPAPATAPTPNKKESAWFIGRQSKRNIRARVMNCHDKAESTIRGMVNVVGIVERFLQTRNNDFRRIEEIPPTELDNYLVDFFYELKKPDGREYDPYSLSNLRSYLDRFLREHGYPYSIGVSPVFAASQHAFSSKRKSLLTVRYTQKELELQMEQRYTHKDMELHREHLTNLYATQMIREMESDPFKLLYAHTDAETASQIRNQVLDESGRMMVPGSSNHATQEMTRNSATGRSSSSPQDSIRRDSAGGGVGGGSDDSQPSNGKADNSGQKGDNPEGVGSGGIE